MPFVFIFIGSVLLIAAVRGTHQNLYALVKRDFTGPNNFIYWVVAILIIGAVGYVQKLKPISDAFLILILVVLFLKRGEGFFDMFTKQIGATQNPSSSSIGVSQPGISGSGGGVVVSSGGAGVSVGSGGVGVTFPGTIRF